MKQILTAFFIFFAVTGIAQGPAADLLAKMPADDNDANLSNLRATTGLGEEGLVALTLMLSAPGAGDNTKLEYALSGYAYYTTQPGNEALRSAAGKAFIKALTKTSDKENKAFIIRQLQVTAQEDAIPVLAAYLGDERLCDPAARALVKIHGAGAGQALLDALKKASNNTRPTLVQALGDSRFVPAAGAIGHLLPSADARLTKASLYALARIGDPGSAKILFIAAEKSGYRYEETEATMAYTDYLHRLTLNGNQKLAEEKATALWKATASGKATEGKSIALAEISQGKSLIATHTAALKLLVDIQGEKSLPLLLQAMDEKDASYRAAALKYALPYCSKSATDQWLTKLSHANVIVKEEILTLLGKSGQQEALPAALSALTDPDEGVRVSAIRASQQIGQEQALSPLLEMLKKGDTSEVKAVASSLVIMKGKGVAEAVEKALPGLPAATQSAMVEVLAARGGQQAVDALYTMAVHAGTAQPGNGADATDALKCYVRLVGLSAVPAEQKLLLLRRAMEMAKTSDGQRAILEEVSGCKTFIALVFAGQYLDNPDLQQPAAVAVMTIALSDTSWSGALVRGLLEKATTVLKDASQKDAIRKHLAKIPAGEGLAPMFNGKDLSGWKGLVENPIVRAKMDAATLQKAQAKADEDMRKSWFAKDGTLQFSGNGENLCTQKKYSDFDMYVDWKIDPDGDAGIYLRGSPQVQIWDTSRRDVGAQVGSGGLYNNTVHESKPLVLADNAIGEWNSFHIIMKGDRVTVYLNGVLVVDNVILENYWDRNLPIFPEEQIELQAHGRHVSYRDLYIQELPHAAPYVLSEEEKKDHFNLLFDGTNMHEWTGNTMEYGIEGDALAVHPIGGNHGNLYTKKEYQDFVYRFDFQLTPGANNGIGIRAPLEGDAAYVGMEIQVLDNEADKYKDLHVYQYHGSVYGVIPAKRGFLKPVGEWNQEEITAVGNHIKVVLNGTTILDGDISDAIKNGTLDKKDHPGLKNVKGHLGFLGHGDVVRFRHMRVKELK